MRQSYPPNKGSTVAKKVRITFNRQAGLQFHVPSLKQVITKCRKPHVIIGVPSNRNFQYVEELRFGARLVNEADTKKIKGGKQYYEYCCEVASDAENLVVRIFNACRAAGFTVTTKIKSHGGVHND